MVEPMRQSQRSDLERRYLCIGNRHVHYWTGGVGEPLVLIHGSPACALYMLPLAGLLARSNEIFAFDTPGFGDSDPLPGEALTMTDLAAAYLAAFDALGLDRIPVFGTHTGAAIALELGYRFPERITGLVLDGLAIFAAEEQTALASEDYMPALEIDALGSQYTKTWTRFRDQFVWFPWFQRTPQQLLKIDLGSTEAQHLWVEMYFRAAKHYRAAYRAAICYGAAGLEAIKHLTVPAVFGAERADMLFPHLERLPQLRHNQRVFEFEPGIDARAALIERSTAQFPRAARRKPLTLPARGGWRRDFLRIEGGQLFFRRGGVDDAPPVLLLHDAPGTGASLQALADEIASDHAVLLPDLPGCGDSDTLSGADNTLVSYARTIGALIEATYRTQAVAVYGVGCGAAVALELLNLAHPKVGRVAITGLLRLSGAERAVLRGRLAPPISLSDDGGHWYRTWLQLRDSCVWWPWFEQRRDHLRRQPAPICADELHTSTLAVMRRWDSYHRVVDAVLEWTPPATPGAARIVVDPWHALVASDEDWISRTPRHSKFILEPNPAGAARTVLAALH